MDASRPPVDDVTADDVGRRNDVAALGDEHGFRSSPNPLPAQSPGASIAPAMTSEEVEGLWLWGHSQAIASFALVALAGGYVVTKA